MQLSHATSNIYSPLRVFAGRIGGQTRRSEASCRPKYWP